MYSKWKYTIDLSAYWSSDDSCKLKNLCESIATQLSMLSVKYSTFPLEAEDFVERFTDLGNEQSPSEEDFDAILEELYDFADRNRIWIKK